MLDFEMESGEPLPKKRRSLFDFQTEDVQNKTHVFPDQKHEVLYPSEYIEKAKFEIEQWKLRITEAMDEMKSSKKEMFEFKNMVYDESCLSEEQLDFLNFDNYSERVHRFCKRLVIMYRKFNRQEQKENEFKSKYLDTQKKIEDTIFPTL